MNNRVVSWETANVYLGQYSGTWPAGDGAAGVESLVRVGHTCGRRVMFPCWHISEYLLQDAWLRTSSPAHLYFFVVDLQELRYRLLRKGVVETCHAESGLKSCHREPSVSSREQKCTSAARCRILSASPLVRQNGTVKARISVRFSLALVKAVTSPQIYLHRVYLTQHLLPI